ncbi:hypothetical protein [Bacillus sp. FJAT-29814]|nr:hypothetical protein [Bacillus sp. FJAT-29814]
MEVNGYYHKRQRSIVKVRRTDCRAEQVITRASDGAIIGGKAGFR